MKNAVSKQTQEYDTPSRSAGEFRNFLSHFWNLFETNGENRSLEPKIEFSETKNAVNVSAEVPGMDEKDLNVEISSDGYLTISGEKKNQVEHNQNDHYFSEVRYGMFRRTVPLPWDLDFTKTEADYEDGVMKIRIHKRDDGKRKKKRLKINKKQYQNQQQLKTQQSK